MGQAIISRRGGGSPQKKQASVYSQNADIGAGTSLTVSLLSCDDGDLMLAYFMCRSAYTLPTGWNLVFAESLLESSITQYIGVAYKVKSSQNGATFTITQETFGRIGAQIFCVKNAGLPYQIDITTTAQCPASGYQMPDTKTHDLTVWGVQSVVLSSYPEYILVEPANMPTYHALSHFAPVMDGQNRLITICDTLGSTQEKKIYRPNYTDGYLFQLVAVGIPYNA